jgi:hypothetical protein
MVKDQGKMMIEKNNMGRGHRGYKLEKLRSYECWSLLTPELLDSKRINSVLCGYILTILEKRLGFNKKTLDLYFANMKAAVKKVA